MTIASPTSSPPPTFRDEERSHRLAHQEAEAPTLIEWADRNSSFHGQKSRLYQLHIPPGSRVLHVGCRVGDTLHRLDPGPGSVGLDLSPALIEAARTRHPGADFRVLDPQNFDLAGQKFDYILIDDALAEMNDIQACLECVRRASHADTRLVLGYYNALWGPVLKLATLLGIRRPATEQNWLGPEDFENLLGLSGFDFISRSPELLLPVRIPVLSAICNRALARIWPFRHLDLMQIVIARPAMAPVNAESMSATVLIPTHNERGNIENAIRRLPAIGSRTEIIFVDGNSSDGTAEEIQRVMAAYPEHEIRFIPQGDGIGKGDAVRKGFAAATGDVLMILDADLTVPPEDLPRFFDALVSGRGEFINGTRLVYPMEDEAMRFLNKLGNRFFSLLFTWLLSQRFRDTLCGTKVMTKANYDRLAANRSYFGDFDPFGDFDLIFGASRMDLKIVEVPVRYRARTYGETSISRFSHGWLLIKMSWVALKRLKLR